MCNKHTFTPFQSHIIALSGTSWQLYKTHIDNWVRLEHTALLWKWPLDDLGHTSGYGIPFDSWFEGWAHVDPPYTRGWSWSYELGKRYSNRHLPLNESTWRSCTAQHCLLCFDASTTFFDSLPVNLGLWIHQSWYSNRDTEFGWNGRIRVRWDSA